MKNSALRSTAAMFILLASSLLVGTRRNATANVIVNGDFATGDLTGWTASAIDSSGNPVLPLIEVMDFGGLNSAVFSTGSFADGPQISTLEQTFTVSSAEPVLSFNFSLPAVRPDGTGTGLSPFADSLVVSVDNGISRELLLVMQGSALPDPFGTAPGPVALGPSTSPRLDYNLQADLSALIDAHLSNFSALGGSEVTLFVDVINEDDGSASDFSLADVLTKPKETKPTPDGASSLVLFLIALSVFHPFSVFASRRTIQ